MKRYVFPRNGSRLLYAVLLSVVTLFAACSDDEINILAEVEVPVESDLTQLERWSYEIPFTIKSDSEWMIETTGDFFYVFPESGTGNGNIKICLLDNDTDVRNEGELRIIFPKDESKNITMKLQQKSTADYDDNAAELSTGNRIYAVGHGYDATGYFSSPDAVKKPIVRFAEMADEELIVSEGVDADVVTEIYTGTSIKEISNKLAVDASVSGGFGKFSAEVKAAFKSTQRQSGSHEYALTYYNVKMENVTVDANLEELRSEWMTEAAYNAINGISSTYPSTDEGFKKLIKDYGTHLIVRAGRGGRIRHSMAVEISEVNSDYDITAFAKASYAGTFIKDASLQVDENYANSYKESKKHCSTQLNVVGGSTKAAKDLINNFNAENVENWVNTLDGKQLKFMVLNEDGLIPLYDLIDDEHAERRELFMQYLNGEAIAKHYPPVKDIDMNYEGNQISQFTIPSFSDEYGSSLIKKVFTKEDRLVAKVCEEYIPVISQKSRVKVIYPVIDGKTKYNMGYFIGQGDLKPARVSWSGDNMTVTSYDEQTPLKSGQQIYLIGSVLYQKMDPDNTITPCTVEDYTIAANGRGGSHDYPVVKIFNRIWMRENFQANRNGNSRPISCKYYGNDGSDKDCHNDAYYMYEDLTSYGYIAPDNWRVAETDDFLAIKNTLESKDVTHISIAKAFFPDSEGGVLGFHHLNFGCWNDGSIFSKGSAGYYACLKSKDKSQDRLVEIRKDEGFRTTAPQGGKENPYYPWNVYRRYAIRLVQELR